MDESFKAKLANTLNNLANAYYVLGKLDRAIGYHKEALKIRRGLVVEDAHSKVRLATSLLLLGISFGTREKVGDKEVLKKLQTEAQAMLQEPMIVKSSQYAELLNLAKILESIISKETER